MELKRANPHVVILNKAYPPWIGGIERHVCDISKELVKRGWKVTALVCNDCNQLCNETIDGVEVIRMPQLIRIFSQPIVTGYLKRLQELKPDLVHVHAPFPLGWGVVNAIPEKIPLICTWHSDIIRQRFLMPLLASFQDRFLARCSKIIATSQPLIHNSSDLRKFSDKCTVIPLAIPPGDSSHEAEILEKAAKIKDKCPKPLFLYVGRLVGYKGLKYLIEAMQSVQGTLLIAGDGLFRNNLEQLTRQLNLQSRVRFLGQISDIDKNALYQAADVFVLPSITANEAFGYVLLESMQRGCAVISTDLPTGVKYVNRHGESGLVVPPKNAQALANAMNRIVGNEKLLHELSEGARKRVDDLFNFDATVDQIEAVYDEALSAS